MAVADFTAPAALSKNAGADGVSVDERRLQAKLWARILPLLAAGLLLNVIDRGNISLAALQMNRALGLSNTSFGLAAGVLSVGFLLFGVPSTLLLRRVGARRWIALILAAWGIFSCATAFVANSAELVAVRLLLGIAEAGFVPGSIFYLTNWFPPEYRGRALATFIFVVPAAGLIGGPVGGALLSMHAPFGLAPWQLLFLAEAAPTLPLALMVLRWLPDSPSDAGWLTSDEKRWLIERTGGDGGAHPLTMSAILGAFRDARVWLLALVYLALATSGGPGAFLPLVINAQGFSAMQTSLIVTGPGLIGLIFFPLWGLIADRVRRGELAVAAAGSIVAVGYVGSAAFFPSPWALVFYSIAAVGLLGFTPAFWTVPSRFLAGSRAATGIAFVNAVGNFGGFLGPLFVGRVVDATGSYKVALMCAAMCALSAGVASLALVPIVSLGQAATGSRTGHRSVSRAI